MIDKLLLMSGNDIPYISAELIIHQPRLKEIGLMTEPMFFKSLDILTISKEKLQTQGNFDLDTQTNFDIFMTIMSEGQEDPEMVEVTQSVFLLLALLFNTYDVQFTEQGIMFLKENETPKFINSINFDDFQIILQEMFCLNDIKKNQHEYNPSGQKAKEIADKLKKRHQLLNKNKDENFSFYDKMSTILAVGLHKTLEEIYNSFTIYQVQKVFERLQKKDSWDMYIAAKIQGASGMDDIDHWLSDLFGKK